jgi:Glycosyltransferase family 87
MAIRSFLKSAAAWWLLGLLVAAGISAQLFFFKKDRVLNDGTTVKSYNNYRIFKTSYNHLAANKDIYVLHPQDHGDLFKYSPAYALLMGPFAAVADFWGLLVFSALNILVWLLAVRKLPTAGIAKYYGVLFFCLLELIGNMQNSQCNTLIAGLILWCYLFLEERKWLLAVLMVLLATLIKPFGLLGFCLFIFYPDKIKSIVAAIMLGVFFAAIPLLVVDAHQLMFLYKSWFRLLSEDHTASIGISVSGWLQTWFGIIAKTPVMVLGLLLLLAPLVRTNAYGNTQFRLYFLASILLWMVLFNHKAESPTFIIAVTGIALWYFSKPLPQQLDKLLLALAFVFTVLSATDLFPAAIRKAYVIPYVLKVVPCIFIWLKLLWDTMMLKPINTAAIV